MNAPSRTKNENKIAASRNFKDIVIRNQRFVLPALAALSVGGHAFALQLGDIDIQSSLGQPLRASIAYALGPREEIGNYCIYLNTGRSASGLPSVGPISIAVSNGAIRLAGKTPVREPLVGLQLTVDCPSAAHFSREYFAFLDPATLSRPNAVVDTVAARISPMRRAEPAQISPPVTRRVQRAPITASRSYRVQPGDTLSDIAERISARSVSIWQAADALFAANPDAFIENNPNLLKAGALLRIPERLHRADGGQVETPTASADPVAAATADDARPTRTRAYTGYSPAAAPRNSTAAEAVAAVPSPGDILLDADGAFVSPIEAPIESPIDNAGLAAAQAAEAVPDTSAPGAHSPPNARGGGSASSSWLMWLAGSGVALILGLLLFSRPLRSRFGGTPGLPFEESPRRRRKTDVDAEDDMPMVDANTDVDFGFGEDARIIALDGDLGAGTGFQDTGEIDVAQDFGFSTSSGIRLGLDMEFSDEPAAMLEEDTDRTTPALPLVQDELPGDTAETGDYDVSMASMPNREVDYSILEQDYEDELTATQALNAELTRAAQQLVRNSHDATDRTAVLPPPDGDGLESTVEMPAERLEADLDDMGDTNVNEELSETHAAENDATVEMEIESATIDTRKLKVS